MRVTLADLVSLLPDESIYPRDVVLPIRPRLLGRSFFPGGCGLAFGGDQPYPERPIMLVGQDFGSASDWLSKDDRAMQRAEQNSPTWRRLTDLENTGLLDLRRCFFTNALLGLRIATSDTGRSPAWMNERYVQASLDCLARQIVLLRPMVVVSLGVESTVLLSRRFGLVPSDWDAGEPAWPSIDGRGLQFREQVTHCDHQFSYASCVHPSYQHLNAQRRSWNHADQSICGKKAHDAIWRRIAAAINDT